MNISKHEADLLARLAAAVIDMHDLDTGADPVVRALETYSDLEGAEDLARRVAHYAYYAGEDLEIS